ncbi:MAG: DUF4157 domain-containing protein [Deltaproteobacteria bacterium]|nr:DUF4157 domain-containing protein [Deltaproteobacteria bacterium]
MHKQHRSAPPPTSTASSAGESASTASSQETSLSAAESGGEIGAQGAGGGGNDFASGLIQRKASPGAGSGDFMDPGGAFASAVEGSGGAVPYQDEMEEAFGEDFSDVEAHLGEKESMDEIGANAAAKGNEAVFAEESPGKEVVAHELTHVLQQGGDGEGTQMSSAVSGPSDAAEVEADQTASAVASGESAGPIEQSGSGIHRQATSGAPTPSTPAGQGQDADPNKPQLLTISGVTPLSRDRRTGVIAAKWAKEAGLDFVKAGKIADRTLGQMNAMISAKIKFQEYEKSYKKAKGQYDEEQRQKEIWDMVMMIAGCVTMVGAITTMAQAGAKAVKTARGLTRTAGRFKKAAYGSFWGQTMFKVTKETAGTFGKEGAASAAAIKDIYQGAISDAQKSVDGTTALTGANKQGITAMKKSQEVVNLAIAANFMVIANSAAEKGASNLLEVPKLLNAATLDGGVIPEAKLDDVETNRAASAEKGKTMGEGLQRLQDLWSAYAVDTKAEGLGDKKERTLFETLSLWKRKGDKRFNMVHVANDEGAKIYDFEKKAVTDTKPDAYFGKVLTGNPYQRKDMQAAHSVMLVDPSIDDELGQVEKGIGASWNAKPKEGVARAALREKGYTGVEHTISNGIARALLAIGVHGVRSDASVWFYEDHTKSDNVLLGEEGRTWFKNWEYSPQFQEFWKAKLGGKYAQIYNTGEKKFYPLPWAPKDAQERSSPTFVGGVASAGKDLKKLLSGRYGDEDDGEENGDGAKGMMEPLRRAAVVDVPQVHDMRKKNPSAGPGSR